MSDSYCVKCRAKTPSVEPSSAQSKNGRAMLKAKCSRCGVTKSSFVKSAPKEEMKQEEVGGSFR